MTVDEFLKTIRERGDSRLEKALSSDEEAMWKARMGRPLPGKHLKLLRGANGIHIDADEDGNPGIDGGAPGCGAPFRLGGRGPRGRQPGPSSMPRPGSTSPDKEDPCIGIGDVTVGRAASADLGLADEKVSQRHCAVEAKELHQSIDLESETGTVVNGDKVARASLDDGHLIRVGQTMLKYSRV